MQACMRVIITIVILSICLAVCTEPSINKKELELSDSDIIQNLTLSRIVSEIKRYNRVDGMVVGISSRVSPLYLLFINFQNVATDKQLVELLKHPNNAVKVYAFWGLKKHRYKKLNEIYLQQLRNDTSRFTFLSACLGTEEKVNEFAYRLLMSYNSD